MSDIIHPAYAIPLSDKDLALLGELTAILGQIDEEMMQSVSGMLLLDRPTTEKIMGSSKVADKANIWASLIRYKFKEPDILEWVTYAIQQIGDIAADRNDLIHGNWNHYGEAKVGDQTVSITTRTPYPAARPAVSAGLVRRVQNFQRHRLASDIQGVRDRAARLSCVVAHITYCLSPHGEIDGKHSPWRDRLPPKPQPRSEKASTRKGRGRGRQRAPSQG